MLDNPEDSTMSTLKLFLMSPIALATWFDFSHRMLYLSLNIWYNGHENIVIGTSEADITPSFEIATSSIDTTIGTCFVICGS